MGTLKYNNLLLHIDIHFQRLKYIINEQSMNINVFLLFFSFVFLQIERERERKREREREREYIKLDIRRNGLKVYLSFFFRRGSCGEYFLFYGQVDFMLFLILAWRIGSFVSEILFVFFYPEYLAFGCAITSPVQQLTFFFSISADGKESPLPF